MKQRPSGTAFFTRCPVGVGKTDRAAGTTASQVIPSRKEESWEDPADFGRSLGMGAEILIDWLLRMLFLLKGRMGATFKSQSTLTQTKQQLQKARPVRVG